MGMRSDRNEWWDVRRNTDRVISSVEDERYRIVGDFDDLPVGPPGTIIPPAAPRIGASPLNLRATTIGDEVRLATAGEAKLFGVSLKDRRVDSAFRADGECGVLARSGDAGDL